MDVLGKVEEITPDGRLIVRCSDLPDIGDAVFNRKEQRIGTVRRVFGPVDGPYASVETKDRNEKLRGDELYTKKVRNNGKGKGRGRRDRGLS